MKIPIKSKRRLDVVLHNENIKRAGVIPYIKKNNTVIFILGLDEAIASISDFGGTREAKDADPLETALREFQEESFGVLGGLSRKNLESSTYVVAETGYHGEEGILFFVKYKEEFPFFTKMREFKERNVPGDETKALVYITKEQILEGLHQTDERIQSSKIFLFHPKVQSILLAGKDVVESL